MYRTHYDKELKVWSGKALKPLYNPKISFGEIVLRALITNGSRIAQISDDSGIKMTFNEIRMKAIRVAINLQRLGYKPNSILGFMARNSADITPIVFGTIFNGFPLNILNPNIEKDELIFKLKAIKPSSMFCDLFDYDLVNECLKELELKSSIFTFGGQKGNSISADSLFATVDNEDDFVPVDVDSENHPAIIVCSSGTTGVPKGVCVSHAALANGIAVYDTMNCDDVMLCYSPLYWVSGVWTLFAGTIKGAKRIITTSSFSPELQFRMVKEHKITHILSPPYHVALSLKSDQLKSADLSSVSCEIVGGSRTPVDLPEQWNKYLKNGKNVHVAYGMSEVASMISIDYPENDKKDTVGQLCPGFVVKIIDNNGNLCGPNVDGEIYLKPPYKFLGYLDNEKTTRELINSDGFLVTGDIGRFDDDGFLYIVDRKKDLLSYRGYDYSPSEIEDFLIQRPEIDSVCVVGILDEIDSELPAAVVIRSKNSHITEDEISKSVAEHFPEFIRLRGGVYFVESLPMSSSGKLLRRKVRDYVMGIQTSKKH